VIHHEKNSERKSVDENLNQI